MALAIAFFAGGCFWCMESDFEKINGVTEVISGYIGGTSENPTYRQVASGQTDYAEAISVKYDPKVISYRELLKNFWINIDPTVKDRQFCDRGKQYRSGIYYSNDSEKEYAEKSKAALAKKFPEIHTEIKAATKFYNAEDYHQNYYKKSVIKYKFYRYRCGRDSTLKSLWGDPKAFPAGIDF